MRLLNFGGLGSKNSEAERNREICKFHDLEPDFLTASKVKPRRPHTHEGYMYSIQRIWYKRLCKEQINCFHFLDKDIPSYFKDTQIEETNLWKLWETSCAKFGRTCLVIWFTKCSLSLLSIYTVECRFFVQSLLCGLLNSISVLTFFSQYLHW